MKIKLLFFGSLSDVIGAAEMDYELKENTSVLEEKLLEQFPKLREYTFRFAVNQEMVDETIALSNRDIVAIMPPFAGG